MGSPAQSCILGNLLARKLQLQARALAAVRFDLSPYTLIDRESLSKEDVFDAPSLHPLHHGVIVNQH
jgi:hypothetical protein